MKKPPAALAQQLRIKFQTGDPFSIARALGMLIYFEPLGEVGGYYNTAYRQRFIHINEELSEARQRFTCAHELGHALLHPKENTPFLRGSTYFSVDRLEREANLFAVCLLISDEDLADHADDSNDFLASLYGLDERLIALRRAH